MFLNVFVSIYITIFIFKLVLEKVQKLTSFLQYVRIYIQNHIRIGLLAIVCNVKEMQNIDQSSLNSYAKEA